MKTRRAPTEEEWIALEFGWKVCEAREVERDCLRARRTIDQRGRGPDEPRGLGEGRRDESGAAARRAPFVASDAYFPFADGVEEAAKHGITAVIQPGGSVRDADVIAAADRLGLAMVFTGVRHFRH